MPETLVKTPVCIDCGSEARPNALFCYHCGGALEIEESKNDVADKSPGDVSFRDSISTTVEDKAVDVQAENETLNETTSVEIVETELETTDSDEVSEIEPDAAEVIEAEIIEVEEISDKKPVEGDDSEDKISEDAENDISEDSAEDKSQVSIKSERFKKRSANKIKPENKPKLKSAAALRKRNRPSARAKKVEIVWEERESSPNVWFVIFALILSLLVAGLVAAALYLK